MLALLAAGLWAQSADVTAAALAVQDALAAGDLATAARLLEAPLAEHPNEATLLNLRGIIHARREELPDARRDFEEAARLSPALTPAWQNLARACQLQAGTDPSALPCAVGAWRKVLNRKPHDAEAHRSLAMLYNSEGDWAASLAESDALTPAERAQTAVQLLRCADLAALGRAVEAGSLATRLAGDSEWAEQDFMAFRSAWDKPAAAPEVIKLVSALDARHAASPGSLRMLAIAYEQQRRFAEARSTLERVAALDPGNTAHLIELARLAELDNAHEAALGYLGHAREIEPGNAQIHFLFAMVSMRLNLPIEARSSLEKALAIDPQSPAYNYAMGFVILSTRDAATATEYFRRYVKARPSEPKGHYALGIACFASGDWEHAKAEMESVEHNASTAGGAEYFLGRIARQEDRLEDAMKHLQFSIELLPDFAESHTELAKVYYRQKNFQRAEAELKRALAIDARSFPANEQLLALYRRTNDPRSGPQAELLKKLDEDRSKRAELMLRSIEIRP